MCSQEAGGALRPRLEGTPRIVGETEDMANVIEGDLVLGRYRLVQRLGSGSSADVWLATDERLGRDVALKVLHPDSLPEDVSRERLVAEARAVAHLRHPGIVGIHDVIAEDGLRAIVFEHIPGETLAARLRRAPRPPAEEAASIVADVADALAAAHAAGIVHGDVKAANIILSRNGNGRRLVDFGIARSLGPEQVLAGPASRPAGQVVGTLSTMAPERLAGKPAGPAADLYSLGVVLYQLLAGRLPYEATTPLALAELQRRPPPPIPDAPPPLAGLARALLRPDPVSRPASAAEVAAFLRGWLEAVQGSATGHGPGSPAGLDTHIRGRRQVGPTDPTLPAPAAPRALVARRRPLVAVPIALAALGGAVGALLAAPSILPPARTPGPSEGSAAALSTASVSLDPSASPSDSPVVTLQPTPDQTPLPTPGPTLTPEPTATPEPLPTALTILSPADGTVLTSLRVDVSGEAPPGSVVTHDIPFAPDDRTIADEFGRWSIEVILLPGENILRFRLGDDRSTEQTIRLLALP